MTHLFEILNENKERGTANFVKMSNCIETQVKSKNTGFFTALDFLIPPFQMWLDLHQTERSTENSWRLATYFWRLSSSSFEGFEHTSHIQQQTQAAAVQGLHTKMETLQQTSVQGSKNVQQSIKI